MRLTRLKTSMTHSLCAGLAAIVSLAGANQAFASPKYATAQPQYNLDTKVHRIHQLAPNLDHKVLKLALKAYRKGTLKGLDKQGVLTVIDFSKASTKKRMWIIDVKHNRILYKLHVAHGQGSGGNIPSKFSNRVDSHQSSLGLYKTVHPYVGKNGYSLRLAGLEPGFNSNAMKRAVVIHGSKYATARYAKTHARLGRSWGCPAIDKAVSTAVINKIKNGTLVFAYYPDKSWLSKSQYLA